METIEPRHWTELAAIQLEKIARAYQKASESEVEYAPLSEEVIAAAHAFLGDARKSEGLPMPSIAFPGDGSIILRWTFGKTHSVSISFYSRWPNDKEKILTNWKFGAEYQSAIGVQPAIAALTQLAGEIVALTQENRRQIQVKLVQDSNVWVAQGWAIDACEEAAIILKRKDRSGQSTEMKLVPTIFVYESGHVCCARYETVPDYPNSHAPLSKHAVQIALCEIAKINAERINGSKKESLFQFMGMTAGSYLEDLVTASNAVHKHADGSGMMTPALLQFALHREGLLQLCETMVAVHLLPVRFQRNSDNTQLLLPS